MAKLFTAVRSIKLDYGKSHEERMLEGADAWL